MPEPAAVERWFWRRKVDQPVPWWEAAAIPVYWVLAGLYATIASWYVVVIWCLLAAAMTVLMFRRWQRSQHSPVPR